MPTFNLKNATLDSLRSMGSMAGGLDLPLKASYALLKNVTELGRHLAEYDKQVAEMLAEYAVKDEDGKPATTPAGEGRVSYKIDPERRGEFSDKRAELDGFVVEGVVIHFAPESAFASDASMKASDLARIAWMIDGLSTLKDEE
jgi:hypothetical protein